MQWKYRTNNPETNEMGYLQEWMGIGRRVEQMRGRVSVPFSVALILRTMVKFHTPYK